MGDSASIIMMGSSAAEGVTSARAQYESGKATRQAYETNARFAELQAEDTIRRGDKEAANVKKRGQQIAGDQRAKLAAQGIELSDGTAADLLSETLEMSAMDALTVKNNAFREAWGLKAQASQDRTQGKLAEIEAKHGAFNKLLTGGLQTASYGYKAFGGKKSTGKEK